MFKSLNAFAKLASDRSEVIGASLVLIIITMMIIPLPPIALDVLIAINIVATLVLVLSAVLLESPLSFSSFPAILLMTTLFRLALTISTTRQILLEANAGEIIKSFGEFVVSGNVVVGLIIFLIISVVNFLVVTKGSERVAEVAARFSLDSMPGKQMSIDGDLRAGNITQEQAKLKRSELEKESQLFGAMDGAIKFVKNDAIAGLVITLINLIGGLTVGMMQMDMTFSEASNTYIILTVGDGLIAIIPSLMTSIAAGLIVTRVTKGEADGANTAQDIFRELSSNKKALQISGIFCAMLAFVPGMPAPVFLAAAAFMLYHSKSKRVQEEKTDADVVDKFTQMLESKTEKVDDVVKVDTLDPIQVVMPELAEPNFKALVHSICKLSRNELVDHSGFVYPVFRFTQSSKVEKIELRIYGIPLLSLSMTDKRLIVFGAEEQINELHDILDLEFLHDIGRHCYLCEPIHKAALDQAGVHYITFERRWSMAIDALLVYKSKEFFNIHDATKHMNSLNDKHGEVIKELIRVMPISKTIEIFQRLLCERVSLRNAGLILANVAEWGQRERDTQIISEQVRRALYEQISYQHSENRVLKILNLDADFEQFLRENVRSDGTEAYLDVDSVLLKNILEMIKVQLKPFAYMQYMPVVVCAMDIRPHFFSIIRSTLKKLFVMSFQEVSDNQEVQYMGSIKYDESLIESSEQFDSRIES
jgi:type III secretion protein V